MIDTKHTRFEGPLRALAVEKARAARAAPHRSICRVSPAHLRIPSAIALTLTGWGILLAAKPWIMAWWRMCILFWLPVVRVPMRSDSLLEMDDLPWPDDALLLLALLLVVAGWAAAGFLRNEKVPLKYLVRILCGILALSVFALWLGPSSFTQTFGGHLTDIAENGYRTMLAVPFMLGLGYYGFCDRLPLKAGYTALILGYFLLMVPHMVVLQAALLHHGSILLMPLLYVCLGMPFDVFVFIALYAWVVSNLPEQEYS